MNKLLLHNCTINKTIIGIIAIFAVLSIGIIGVFDQVAYVHAAGVSDSVSSSDGNSGSASFANNHDTGVASATGKAVDCYSVNILDIDFSHCSGYNP